MSGKNGFFSIGIAIAILATLKPAWVRAAAPFQPATLNNQAELTFIRGKIQAGEEPWKSDFAAMKSSGLASLSYAATPRDTVECGYYSNPDRGCKDESNDSKAAYTQALMWMFTGNAAYAAKAAEILDAWSAKLKRHTNGNAPLQASWTGAVFPRAAVILEATYPAWGPANRQRFSRMLDSAFVPLIRNGNLLFNGNWELTYAEALMEIGIFNGDTASFNKGVFLWRKRTPAYFYLKSDGALPFKPYGTTHFDNPKSLTSLWYNPGVWPDGLCQETCRDFGHTQMGLAAMIDAAEIALHQGVDLYSGEADRLVAAMEFHARILLGMAPPAGLCGGTLNLSLRATWEIGYNHFHNRMGRDLPLTRQLILTKIRPSGVDTHMAWESMTHAELGSQGLATAVRPPVGQSARGAVPALGWKGGKLVIIKAGTIFALDGKRMEPASP